MSATQSSLLPVQERSTRWFAILVVVLAVLAAGAALVAQVAGDRGIAPVASSSDYEVRGISVDTRGETAEEAREAGWREAQRLAWERLDGPKVSDAQLEQMISGIVIEREQVGPRRYIATLGVVFDRARASAYLGGEERARGSAPMLLLPVTVSAGSYTIYEVRNPWQRAWAEYQAGQSRIDYLRPSGAGGDSLLLNYGQVRRRSRAWWRTILDQFGAADVLVPVAQLKHQWPGGPIRGHFVARYGPDSKVLGSFSMTAENPDALPAMLERAVLRFDEIFTRALEDGQLRPDPTLDVGASGTADPALQRLIDIGRALQRADAAAIAGEETPAVASAEAPVPVQVERHIIQFESPDAAAIDATLGAMRAVPGVRGAVTTSIAIGGTSVMAVSFGGTLDDFATALRQRGYSVRQGANALAISR